MPGITPPGITDIRAVIARTRQQLADAGEVQTLAAIDVALRAGTAGAALGAIVAFQGGLNETISKARTGLDSFLVASARVARGLAPRVRLAETGWRDSVKFAENAVTFVGGPADLMKKQLRLLPPEQKLSVESLHEVERELLAYAVAIRGVTWSLRTAAANLTEALVPISVSAVVEETIANLGKTLGWVLGAALKGAGQGLPPILGALPWWVWAAGGLVLLNFFAPVLSLARRRD